MNRITHATHVTMAEELSAHITQLANLVTGLAEELKEFKQEVRSGQTRDGGDPGLVDPEAGLVLDAGHASKDLDDGPVGRAAL